MNKYRSLVGSTAEAECLTRVAGELGYLSENVVNELERLLERTMAAMHGLTRSIGSVG